MDSDFGAAQPHILNQRIDDLMREGNNGEFMSGTNNGPYSESGIGSNAGSACPSRKTSGVSEGVVMDQGSDSQVESPSDSPVSVQNDVQGERETESVMPARQESLPDSPKATPEAAQQRTRKLSRFLVSPVILPDNTVAEKLPDPPKPEPVVPTTTTTTTQEPAPQTVQQIQQAVSMQQAVETQQQLIQNVAPPIQNQYVNEQVIQTVQYQPIPSQPVPVAIETGEAQQVMVYDPKWQQDEQHALINQQLQQAMGLTPSQPVSSTTQIVPATPHPTVLQDPQLLDYPPQLMPEPQLAQLQQFQATQQLLMDNNAPSSRDAMDSMPAAAGSMKLPETLEQLQKELENITHAHVSTKKESAPTTQNTSIAEANPISGTIIVEGQVVDGSDVDGVKQSQDVLSQAEILQQQIQSYDNTSSISDVTTVNTSSGGPLSRDDTSVCNSRRTSTDMNIEYGQTQAQIMYVEGTQGPVMVTIPIQHQPAGDEKGLSHQSSVEKSDR